MLTKRVMLTGSKAERIVQMLTLAGWYVNRKVEIAGVEEYYQRQGVLLTQGAKLFFQEFYGLAGDWYLEYDYAPNKAPDFNFTLFPNPDLSNINDWLYDDAEYTVFSEEYQGVKKEAKQEITLVGEIGYYYPARVWIAEDRGIYTTHEYDYEIHGFQSITELIQWELLRHSLDAVTMKNKASVQNSAQSLT